MPKYRGWLGPWGWWEWPWREMVCLNCGAVRVVRTSEWQDQPGARVSDVEVCPVCEGTMVRAELNAFGEYDIALPF